MKITECKVSAADCDSAAINVNFCESHYLECAMQPRNLFIDQTDFLFDPALSQEHNNLILIMENKISGDLKVPFSQLQNFSATYWATFFVN